MLHQLPHDPKIIQRRQNRLTSQLLWITNTSKHKRLELVRLGAVRRFWFGRHPQHFGFCVFILLRYCYVWQVSNTLYQRWIKLLFFLKWFCSRTRESSVFLVAGDGCIGAVCLFAGCGENHRHAFFVLLYCDSNSVWYCANYGLARRRRRCWTLVRQRQTRYGFGFFLQWQSVPHFMNFQGRFLFLRYMRL